MNVEVANDKEFMSWTGIFTGKIYARFSSDEKVLVRGSKRTNRLIIMNVRKKILREFNLILDLFLVSLPSMCTYQV